MRDGIGGVFSGIGGFELGLQWAGWGPVRFTIEQEPFCQRVLRKHWPQAKHCADVRTVDVATLPQVSIVCGGFPCQDVSLAGKREGLSGCESGLWSEQLRVIAGVRPKVAVIENVTSLVLNGLDRVLFDLDAIGFDAVWFTLSASDFGAKHKRSRLFVVAYPHCEGELEPHESKQESEQRALLCACAPKGSGCLDRVAREFYGVPPGLDGFLAPPPVFVPARSEQEREARIKALGNALMPQCAYLVGKVAKALVGNGS